MSNNNYMCYECINVTGSGCGNPKIFGVLRAPVAEPPLSKFLDPPLV